MSENPCFYWDRPDLTMHTPTGKGLPTMPMVLSVHDPATIYPLHRYAGSRDSQKRCRDICTDPSDCLKFTGQPESRVIFGLNSLRSGKL